MRFVRCAILTIGFMSGCATVQVGVTNPIPALTTVAVAPFFNLSQEPEFVADGRRVALAYYAELQKVPGYQVIPVGVVEEAARAHRLELANPDDALKLCEILGCDAVVVGAITDFDPYYPPRLGLQVSWYSPYPWQFEPGVPIDPHARNALWQRDLDERRAARRAEAERRHRALERAQERLLRRHDASNCSERACDAGCVAPDDGASRAPNEPSAALDAASPPILRAQSPGGPMVRANGRVAVETPREFAQPPSPPWWEGETRNFGEWRTDEPSLGRPPQPPEQMPRTVADARREPATPRTQSPYFQHLFDAPPQAVDVASGEYRSEQSVSRRPIAAPTRNTTANSASNTAGPRGPMPRLDAGRPSEEPVSPSKRAALAKATPSPPHLNPSPFASPPRPPNAPREIVPASTFAPPFDFDPRQPLMSYTRLFDGSDAALLATLRDWLELGGNQRAGGWEASLHRTDEFLKFCSHLMVVEMLTLHGGESQHRLVIKKRRYR